MKAFINGALSALNRCLNLILILDPEGKDENLVQMWNQITIYIEMYKAMEEERILNPVIDETWKNIEEASDTAEEDLEKLNKKFDA